MKERFAKLLLGEDMSGGGKGVSSALALSNAITNLAGTSSSILKHQIFSKFPFALHDKTFSMLIFIIILYMYITYSLVMQLLSLGNKSASSQCSPRGRRGGEKKLIGSYQ